MRIILTGNIASGKSTVLEMLAKKLPLYNTLSYDAMVDAAYRDTLVRSQLRSAFGTDLRPRISELLFSSSPAKRINSNTLQRFIGDFVNPKIEAGLSASQGSSGAVQGAICEYPMYFESGIHLNPKNYVIAVVCDTDVQLERMVARDGQNYSMEVLLAKNSSQLDTTTKCSLAEWIINTTNPEAVEAQVDELVQSIQIVDLEDRFYTLYERNVNNAKIWTAIREHYTFDGRAYHTLGHLAQMFALLDTIKKQVPATMHRVVQLAIWFHDMDMGFEGNTGVDEQYSINTMMKLHTTHAIDVARHHTTHGYNTLAIAASMIRCTINHTVDSPLLLKNPDMKLATEIFLDLDMSILASSKEAFDKYEKNICLEYWRFEGDQYKQGRYLFIQRLLDKPQLFLSPALQHLEQPARDNLSRLLISKMNKE